MDSGTDKRLILRKNRRRALKYNGI